MARQHSNPDVNERIVAALDSQPDDQAEGEDLAAIQRGLDIPFNEVSKTQFRLAIGALAHAGAITWKRSSWGSLVVVRLNKSSSE